LSWAERLNARKAAKRVITTFFMLIGFC